MRRIKILNVGTSAEEAAKLSALAVEAGLPAGEVEIVGSVGEPDTGCSDEVILVLASSAVCTDPTLEQELAMVPRGGRRAICIWPAAANEPPTEPTEAMLKYAYSIICFDAEGLRSVVADDDNLCFETPTGTPLPKPETERNLCVDEEEEEKQKEKVK